MFTTSDADLGADLDPDHRLLLRFVRHVDGCVNILSCCFNHLYAGFRPCSVSQLYASEGKGRPHQCAYEVKQFPLSAICVSGAATRRMLHSVLNSRRACLCIVRSCCFYLIARLVLDTLCCAGVRCLCSSRATVVLCWQCARRTTTAAREPAAP